ncbi:MAG TPA: hypothetical protein VJT73_17200, partial [Polyangiaceae bacterium]|nr:hypothetical protein [Polyangiaceae bacterium]
MRVPLLLVVPSAAMAVVGFALFGPGAVRPFNGAQIWGGPTEGASRLSWRILVLERLRGIDSTRNLGAIMVRVAVGEGSPVSVPCQTRPDGTCEIQVALAELLHGSVRATVEAADGSPLASGEFARDARGWGSEGHPTRITGHASGELHLEAFAARGVFAAPFSDALDVYVYRGDEHVAGASVTLRADEA